MVNMSKLPPCLPACITVCQDGGLTCIIAVPEYIPQSVRQAQQAFEKVQHFSGRKGRRHCMCCLRGETDSRMQRIKVMIFVFPNSCLTKM